MWTIITLVISIALLLYGFIRKKYKYWQDRGVPHPEPTFLVGNIGQTLNGKKHLGHIYEELYRRFDSLPYIGFYKFIQPAIMLRDPELIKSVMTKDFSYFEKNDLVPEELSDPITERHPFVLYGHKWKVIRGLITPNFTSGKVKNIFPLVLEVNDKFTKHLAENYDKPIDIGQLTTKYTSENFASCAFGIVGNSFDPNESEFVRMILKFGDIPAFELTKANLLSMFPILRHFFTLRLFKKSLADYLTTVVRETINYRTSNKVKRNDFLDTLIGLKNSSNVEFPFEEIDVVAQAASFFGDGVITSSLVINQLLFELAQNQDEQELVKREIDAILDRHGKLCYEAVQEMTYLDCAMNESLRKHSPIVFLLKRCTKAYRMPPIDGNGREVIIEENTPVVIPIDSLHHDETYFPEPEKFKPERFFKENKDNIMHCTFLPFGVGPRLCLGMTFGILQVKMAAIAAIKDYRIELNEKTILPLRYDPTQFLRVPVGGIWLNFIKRN